MATRAKKVKKPKHSMLNKRAFLRRMLRVGEEFRASKSDIIFVHEIFSWYPEEIDFMAKVGPPPFKLNNILWFKTEEGKKYLTKKLREFHYKIEEYEKPVDTGVKSGDDKLDIKVQSIRKFLE
jgi:hypothetical protein